MILPQKRFRAHFNSDFFSLDVQGHTDDTTIILVAFDELYTSDFPKTFPILKKHLPSVLKSQCFNDAQKPFFEEVKDTEIAHLFEHILLEYLCQEKLADGKVSADFSGWTEWNWKKHKHGSYLITINCGECDAHLLPGALQKAITLMSLIIDSKKKRLSKYGSLVIGSKEPVKT